MLTLREQLQHKPFRQWMAKTPRLKAPGQKPPWRVYVQRHADGNWAFKDFETYPEAYRYVAKNIKRWYDMALHSRRIAFQPPVVRTADGIRKYYSPAPADFSHEWCGYCRRMSQFRFFINGRHPVIGKCDATEKRCTICGVRLSFLNPYGVFYNHKGE